jgi:hypothetical protein
MIFIKNKIAWIVVAIALFVLVGFILMSVQIKTFIIKGDATTLQKNAWYKHLYSINSPNMLFDISYIRKYIEGVVGSNEFVISRDFRDATLRIVISKQNSLGKKYDDFCDKKEQENPSDKYKDTLYLDTIKKILGKYSIEIKKFSTNCKGKLHIHTVKNMNLVFNKKTYKNIVILRNLLHKLNKQLKNIKTIDIDHKFGSVVSFKHEKNL